MKTYEDAIAWVQELIKEERSNDFELLKLSSIKEEAELYSTGDDELTEVVDSLRQRNQTLRDNIQGALAVLHFLYREDGHDVYGDAKYNLKKG